MKPYYLLLPLLAFTLNSSADLLLQFQEGKKPNSTRSIYLHGLNLKLTHPDRSYLLFNARDVGLDQVNILTGQQQHYDPTLLDNLDRIIEDEKAEALEQAQQQIAYLPEEEQQQAMAMLEFSIESESEIKPALPIRYTKTDDRKTIAGWSCQVYQAHQGKEKIHTVCLASAQSLKLQPDESATFWEFVRFADQLEQSLPGAVHSFLPGGLSNLQSPQIPLELSSRDGEYWQLKRIKRQQPERDEFDLPVSGAAVQTTQMPSQSKTAKAKLPHTGLFGVAGKTVKPTVMMPAQPLQSDQITPGE